MAAAVPTVESALGIAETNGATIESDPETTAAGTGETEEANSKIAATE